MLKQVLELRKVLTLHQVFDHVMARHILTMHHVFDHFVAAENIFYFLELHGNQASLRRTQRRRHIMQEIRWVFFAHPMPASLRPAELP
jgi:hypothetical protein